MENYIKDYSSALYNLGMPKKHARQIYCETGRKLD